MTVLLSGTKIESGYMQFILVAPITVQGHIFPEVSCFYQALYLNKKFLAGLWAANEFALAEKEVKWTVILYF